MVKTMTYFLHRIDFIHLRDRKMVHRTQTFLPSQKQITNCKKSMPKAIRHRVTFTTTEYMDLAKGMVKYGYDEWTKMLKDPTFKFNCTRTPEKLKNRHLNVNLINLMYNRIWLLKKVKQRVIS